MATDYSKALSEVAVAQVAEAAGFETMQESALDILSDLLIRYIGEIGATCHGYAELANRTDASADDLLMTFKDLGIRVEDVIAYTDAQEESPFVHTLPPYPVQRTPKWPPNFSQRKEAPPEHVPDWLPAFPDKHTYVSTPAFAGHEKDEKKQRLAASKAKRQAEKSLVKLSERLGEQPGGAAAATLSGGNPFLAPPTWEAASAAAAAEPPASAAQTSSAPGAAVDTEMQEAAQQEGSLADAFAAAGKGGDTARPTGAWAEASHEAAGRPPDALSGALPSFAQGWGGIAGRLRPAIPAFREEEDAFAAAETAAAAAAHEAKLKGIRKASTKSRSNARTSDAAAARANEILAAGADAVLTMGEDAPGRDGTEQL